MSRPLFPFTYLNDTMIPYYQDSIEERIPRGMMLDTVHCLLAILLFIYLFKLGHELKDRTNIA